MIQAERGNEVAQAEALRTLGLEGGASCRELRRSYVELLKQWHPDLFMQDDALRQEAEERTKQINLAYELLKQGGFEAAGRARQDTPRQSWQRACQERFDRGFGSPAAGAEEAEVVETWSWWGELSRAQLEALRIIGAILSFPFRIIAKALVCAFCDCRLQVAGAAIAVILCVALSRQMPATAARSSFWGAAQIHTQIVGGCRQVWSGIGTLRVLNPTEALSTLRGVVGF
jgi:hypothetical protein